MKFDFNPDDDAANTTTGAEAMTSATGVELDMPIKPVRDHGDHHAMSVRALPKQRNRRPEGRDRARLSVAVDVGHADLWRPVHGVAAASRANTSISRTTAWSPRQLGQR